VGNCSKKCCLFIEVYYNPFTRSRFLRKFRWLQGPILGQPFCFPSVSHRYTTNLCLHFSGESLPPSPNRCAISAYPICGGTPQHPENRSGADDALCPAGPLTCSLYYRSVLSRAVLFGTGLGGMAIPPRPLVDGSFAPKPFRAVPQHDHGQLFTQARMVD